MKLAFLILCHKNPEQINELVNSLKHPDVDIYIHIDKKSRKNVVEKLEFKNYIHILSDNESVNVSWGTFSQVQATLSLLHKALNKKYDYYWLISGQDFPIAKINKILDYLSEQTSNNYINLFLSKNVTGQNSNYDKRNQIFFSDSLLKNDLTHRIVRRLYVMITGGYRHTFRIFTRPDQLDLNYYFGSQWWCINKSFAEYIINYLIKHPEYIDFYKKTSCPDESFFQTLLMNSEYRNTRQDFLHYIDWSEGKSSPKTLKCEDLEKLFKSNKLMARKFDIEEDSEVLRKIKKF